MLCIPPQIRCEARIAPLHPAYLKVGFVLRTFSSSHSPPTQRPPEPTAISDERASGSDSFSLVAPSCPSCRWLCFARF